MAIRFRCAYCNQLMGIASRKVGTVVRCPKCSQQTVVPATSETEPSPSASPPPTAETSRPGKPTTPLPRNHAVDAESFGSAFEVPAHPHPTATTEVIPFADTPQLIDDGPIIYPVQRPGQQLTWLWWFLAVVLAMLLLAGTFFAGWFARQAYDRPSVESRHDS